MYKKRPGTSGVQGQLYETKLLSLILFRAQHDDSIEEFQLATNMEGAGDFDDICFKAKIKGHENPLIAFLQVKHREKSNKILTLNGKQFYKYFQSYLEIKKSFNPKSQNLIFNDNFHNTDCRFIIYTNADGDILQNNETKISISPHLDALVRTGEVGARVNYTNENVEFISLAKQFAKYLYNYKNSQQNMMNDTIVIRYHVILEQKVLNVYGQPEEQRKCSFRDDFFTTDDNDLKKFRDLLFKEVLKIQKIDETKVLELLSQFLSVPSETTLSDLIERVLIYAKGNLKLIRLNDNTLKKRIAEVKVSVDTVYKAIEIAAKRLLRSTEFSIPAAFGNPDLLIRGNKKKIEKRLSYLKTKIFDLIEKSKPNNVIIIDDSVEDGLVRLNGGLGSAVGNLLVYDQNRNLLKFSDSELEYNARTLLRKLITKIPNLDEYSFDVKLKKFPVLVLNDEIQFRDFLEKVIFYTKQAHQSVVEKDLKEEIKNLSDTCKSIICIKPETIFLKYHDRVQKWWMSSKESIPFLTKTMNVYQLNDLVNNPLTSILCTVLMYKIKSMEGMFNDNMLLTIDNLSKTLVVAEIINLTLIRIIRSLKNARMDFIVLDFLDILKMEKNDIDKMILELNNPSDDKVIIIVCDIDANCSIFCLKIIEMFALSTHEKKLIVITNNDKKVVKIVKQYFSVLNEEIVDNHTYSLEDLKPVARETVIKNAQIIFQGETVSLNLLLDNELKQNIVQGYAFNKILLNETVIIGESLADPNYDEISTLYIDRSLIRHEEKYKLKTFLDIEDAVVLVTAGPGMGKSTLLTHLSLRTKEDYRDLWIIRINLLSHSAQLKKWKKDETIIDTTEMIYFMSQVITRKQTKEVQIHIVNMDNMLYLKDYAGDESVIFEIKMFLNCLNQGKVIFLFDGFDEIVPYYTETAIMLLNVVKMNCGDNKLWVTSRAYSEIQSILHEILGTPFELKNISERKLSRYLDTFWSRNLVLYECMHILDLEVYQKIEHFLKITLAKKILITATLSPVLGRVLVSLIEYLEMSVEMYGHHDLMKTTRFLLRDYEYQVRRSALSHRNNVASPMLTYLAADYFACHIKDSDISENNSSLNTSTVYEWFIEKIVRQYFVQKKKVDLNNPYIIVDYETALANFIEMHKKMAVYAIFQDEIHNIFNTEELKKIDDMLTSIKDGREKTELICGVSNNIPQFTHKTFAEYLAVEYLLELMKDTRCHNRRGAMGVVISSQIDSLCVWINQKLQKEEYKGLSVYFPDIELVIIPFPAF